MFHVVLRIRHLVGVLARVLVELLQNVEQLRPVLLLLLVLKEQRVVLKELVLSRPLIQVFWLGAVLCPEYQILRLVVSWVNWTGWLRCVNL